MRKWKIQYVVEEMHFAQFCLIVGDATKPVISSTRVEQAAQCERTMFISMERALQNHIYSVQGTILWRYKCCKTLCIGRKLVHASVGHTAAAVVNQMSQLLDKLMYNSFQLMMGKSLFSMVIKCNQQRVIVLVRIMKERFIESQYEERVCIKGRCGLRKMRSTTGWYNEKCGVSCNGIKT